MTKRVLSLFLCAVLILSNIPVLPVSASDSTNSDLPEGITYSITLNQVTITGYLGNEEHLILPDTILGFPVIKIGPMAFRKCDPLQSISLGAYVTEISYYAFQACTNLKEIALPATITKIDKSAFSAVQLRDVYFAGDEEAWTALDMQVLEETQVHLSCDDPQNHWVVDEKKATCTADGYTCEICSCGYQRNQESISSLGHDLGNWITSKDATCTSNGTKQKDCSRCDYFETEEIGAIGHEYKPVITAPTCTEKGYTTHICSCGMEYVDAYTSALGHDMNNWTTTNEPTCTIPGTQQKDCSRCDHFETQEINATGHSYKSEVTVATCTEQGYTTHTCACGDSYVDSYRDAWGHLWNEASCTTAKTCKVCGIKEDSALGHSWNDATCTTAKTCKICGVTEGNPLGHSWNDATCTAAKTCRTCGTAEGNALGHSWANATCTAAKSCITCGTTEGTPLGHHYVDNLCANCGIQDPNYKEPPPSEPTPEPEPEPESTTLRLAGAHRYETALKVADQMKGVLGIQKFNAVIVASGATFADALAGSYLSTVKKAPILLSYGGGGKYAYLDTNNLDYIRANLKPGGIVYLLGGESAVPKLYDSQLSGFIVIRLGGKDRFETNLMILKEAGVKAGQEILVCTATDFADSLSASATGLPILLVFNQKGTLYSGQAAYLKSLDGKNTFCIIGGTNAVGTKLENALGQYGKVTRLAGDDRLKTSVLVAEKYFPKATSAVLAYGWDYPDGLCGGALAYAMKSPLLLTYSAPKYYAVAADYITHHGIKSGIVLGGEKLISQDAVDAIF